MKHRIRLHGQGPALWPSGFPLRLLRARQRELGTALFATVYQGEPAPEGGSIFQWAWFLPYERLPRLVEVGQAWDTAVKGGPGHDYSCAVTAGRGEDGCLYLLDVWRGQVEAPTLKRQMVALAQRFAPRWILFEDRSAASSLAPLLRAEGHRLPLIPVRPEGSKAVRAAPASAFVEGGGVRVPRSAPWLEAFRAEVVAFPAGPHDDQVDAFVYLVERFTAQKTLTMQELARIRRPEGL